MEFYRGLTWILRRRWGRGVGLPSAQARTLSLFRRILCPAMPQAVSMSANALCAFIKDAPEIFNYKCGSDSDCPASTHPKICHSSCQQGWRYTSRAVQSHPHGGQFDFVRLSGRTYAPRGCIVRVVSLTKSKKNTHPKNITALCGGRYTSKSMPGEFIEVPPQGVCYRPIISEAVTNTEGYDPLSVLDSDGTSGRTLGSCDEAVEYSLISLYAPREALYCRADLDGSYVTHNRFADDPLLCPTANRHVKKGVLQHRWRK